MYSKSHKEHWLQDKDAEGRMLILEDGSRWEISALDRHKTSRWLRMSTIHVEELKQDSYLLKNTIEQETARASHIESPSGPVNIPIKAA